MAFIRYLHKIQHLDNLIRKKSTGNQSELAKKVRISRSLLNIYIGEMKCLGFPIAYSRSRKTYYYSKEGCMVTSLFNNQELSREEMKKYKGGASDYANSRYMNLTEIPVSNRPDNLADHFLTITTHRTATEPVSPLHKLLKVPRRNSKPEGSSANRCSFRYTII